MKITPTSLSISQLFSSKNEQFFIPAYQRRFSWVWKQLGELFDDIHRTFKWTVIGVGVGGVAGVVGGVVLGESINNYIEWLNQRT